MPMSPDEQRMLAGLFDRTRQAANTPRDPDAERFIAEQIRYQPAAPYLLTQAVLVQEQALASANERIQQLEQQVAELERQASQASPAAAAGGGFLGGLFGGGRPQGAPPAQSSAGFGGPRPSGLPGSFGGGAPGRPMAASGAWGGGQPTPGPQPQGGPWMQQPQAQPQQGGGGGFLKGAMATAAGVAGGALLFEGIKGAMGGNSIFGSGQAHAASSGFGGTSAAASPQQIEQYGSVGDASFEDPQSGGSPDFNTGGSVQDASFDDFGGGDGGGDGDWT